MVAPDGVPPEWIVNHAIYDATSFLSPELLTDLAARMRSAQQLERRRAMLERRVKRRPRGRTYDRSHHAVFCRKTAYLQNGISATCARPPDGLTVAPAPTKRGAPRAPAGNRPGGHGIERGNVRRAGNATRKSGRWRLALRTSLGAPRSKESRMSTTTQEKTAHTVTLGDEQLELLRRVTMEEAAHVGKWRATTSP
jgi:hypothetical protein